jgi:hypothetical protein
MKGELCSLTNCYAVLTRKSLPRFRKCVLPPPLLHPDDGGTSSSKILVSNYQSTRCKISQDMNIQRFCGNCQYLNTTVTNKFEFSFMILFTRICVSRMFARCSRLRSLSSAQLSPHTLTPSWTHHYTQRTPGDSNDDGHPTGCTKEAPLDAFLTNANLTAH